MRDRLTPIPCVPTGSGDFPSNSNRIIIVKAAGKVFLIYEEPRKSEFTDLELPNTEKYGLRLEIRCIFLGATASRSKITKQTWTCSGRGAKYGRTP